MGTAPAKVGDDGKREKAAIGDRRYRQQKRQAPVCAYEGKLQTAQARSRAGAFRLDTQRYHA